MHAKDYLFLCDPVRMTKSLNSKKAGTKETAWS
jgi:hypothetical protein